MDTEEMYDRGVADAERGELHPFYYQHYYHYRRGYDKTRRRLRRPRIWDGTRAHRGQLLLVVALAIVGVGAFVTLRSRAQPAASPHTPVTASLARSATSTPTRTPIFPTAVPSPAPPTLHVGGMAQVTNTEGKVLRGRQEPNLKSRARTSFNEGERVRILDGPVEADGYTWWRLEGQSGSGWSAQQSLDGVVWLQPIDG